MKDSKPIDQPRVSKQKRHIYYTELYRLLVDTLPICFISGGDRIKTERLSQELGMARWTLYRWFNGECMRKSSAMKLVEISAKSDCERKGALTLEKLAKFGFGFNS